MYEELAIVVGKDTATSGFSKSYVDIENEPNIGDRDGNFALPCFDPPLLALPRAGFPRPAKMVGRGWGEILDPHFGAGRGWVYTF